MAGRAPPPPPGVLPPPSRKQPPSSLEPPSNNTWTLELKEGSTVYKARRVVLIGDVVSYYSIMNRKDALGTRILDLITRAHLCPWIGSFDTTDIERAEMQDDIVSLTHVSGRVMEFRRPHRLLATFAT